MNKPKVFFRADGNSQTGLGHVIRSCALADALRDQCDCTFFIREPSDYLKIEIERAGCNIQEMPAGDSYHEEAEKWAVSLSGAEIIVLDGYRFDTIYQQHLKQGNCRLICIDDIHAYHFVADLVINHAGSASTTLYDAEPYTQFFLGFRYSLLRKAFLQKRTQEADDRNLLICLGGADPDNQTTAVLEKVKNAGFSTIHVLVGAGFLHLDLLQRSAMQDATVKIYQNLDANAVAELMQHCSHAVLSPSSIAIEYMSFGGIVYLNQIADNQQYIRQYLINSGLAFDINDLGRLNVNEAEQMRSRQREVFDGKSLERLQQAFAATAFMANANIQKALISDLSLTLMWANDPLARQMSYNSQPISAEDHATWFAAKINDPACFYYIFRHNGQPFGQIRFDQKGDEFVLSYYISSSHRGKGLGSFILSEGVRCLKQDAVLVHGKIIGFVKNDNRSSCLSFEKMKFTKTETDKYINSSQFTLIF